MANMLALLWGLWGPRGPNLNNHQWMLYHLSYHSPQFPNTHTHARTHADSPPYFLSLLPFVTFSCMESIQLYEIYPLGVTSRWPQRHCILLLLSVVTASMSDSKSNQLLSESPVHSVSQANQILGGWRHRWLTFGCKGKPWMRFFFSFIYNVIY